MYYKCQITMHFHWILTDKCLIASVYLRGGPGPWAGTVYARNPTSGIDGPVCDDLWGIEDVRANTLVFAVYFQKCNN